MLHSVEQKTNKQTKFKKECELKKNEEKMYEKKIIEMHVKLSRISNLEEHSNERHTCWKKFYCKPIINWYI